MKNVVRLEHHYFPWQLEAAPRDFVTYYNNRRLRESLGNVTPADVCYGRDHAVLSERQRIKQLTLRKRRIETHAEPAGLEW
jgi:putative transposase